MPRHQPDNLLSLFPLPSVVLFPGVRVPLHIFEPRYRAMTQAALTGSQRIGMVTVLPEHVSHIERDPPVFVIGCEGKIVSSERLPNGRYNIVLLGTRRFRICAEPPRPSARLYRIAQVERLDDSNDPADASRLHALRSRVSELFIDLVSVVAPTRAPEISPSFFAGMDDTRFANTLCQVLDLPAVEKQGLLEANSIPERLERLSVALQFRLAELTWRGTPQAKKLH